MAEERRWFGWIPALTPELMIDYFIRRLKLPDFSSTVRENEFILLSEEEEIRGKNLEFFDENKRKAIKQRLTFADGDTIFYSLTNFDDQQADRYAAYAVVVNKDGMVEEVGIFDSARLDRFNVGRMEKIEPNGLAIYSISQHKFLGRSASYIFFDIVRDLYHEHVYAHQTDRLLLPVLEKDRNNALNSILSQYKEKILTYHKSIKEELDKATTFIFVATQREAEDIKEDIINAKGEMIYALNFTDLFFPDSEVRHSFERALKSFENLLSSLDMHIDIQSTMTNFYVLLLTYVTLTASLAFFSAQFGLSMSLALILPPIFVFCGLPFFHWYTRRRSKKR